ncbi:MAG: hypothetical protein RBG13Loki_2004 [Promethearchaeota archaeon CR_4]|nr:MAG: hypothetical protein RBG13Loki_2004 [Candidatus Lokiarchaeota archaeon CR_4]
MTEQKHKDNVLDKEMPAVVTKTLGKVGPKSWVDLLVMVAGIWCLIVIIVKWINNLQPNVFNIIYYILCIWVYANVALCIKAGPFFASKFKSVSGTLSFLRDENDAKNFVVILGAWTALLDTLVGMIAFNTAFGFSFIEYMTVFWMYLVPLVIFGFYLVKGFFSRKRTA